MIGINLNCFVEYLKIYSTLWRDPRLSPHDWTIMWKIFNILEETILNEFWYILCISKLWEARGNLDSQWFNESTASFIRKFKIIRIILKGVDLFFLGQHFKYFVFLLLKYSGRVIDQSIYSVTFTAIVSIM